MARNFYNGINLNLTQLLNAVAQVLATDPARSEGRFYYSSTRKTWVFHTDTAIIDLGRLDQIAPPTGPVNLNAQRITSLADPTAAQDAVTRAYLDAQITALNSGQAWKDSVRVASTANVAVATGTVAGQVIDGVTLVAGDRILLKDQTTASENGIYVVQPAGAAIRSADANTAEGLRAATVLVEQGTANFDTGWNQTADGITVGTTALTWVKIFGGATSQVRKFVATVGGAASMAVTHSFSTRNVIVQVDDASTFAVVEPDIVKTDVNTVTITEATAPAAGSRIVTILG